MNPARLTRAAGIKASERRSLMPPDGATGGGASRLVAPVGPSPNDNIDGCRFFHRTKAKRMNINMASPATLPTTPPTTTGVDVVEESEPLPLPDPAVLVAVLAELAAVPPPIPPTPPTPVAVVDDDTVGE